MLPHCLTHREPMPSRSTHPTRAICFSFSAALHWFYAVGALTARQALVQLVVSGTRLRVSKLTPESIIAAGRGAGGSSITLSLSV